MVDRVAPKTNDALRKLVADTTGLEDAWPVSAEPFSQWVIEDNFAAERPPFDTVGAVFSDDISLFEQMKLRFLNAGHSIISSLAYLHDKSTIHEALDDENILRFVTQTLHESVLPVTIIPSFCNGEDYISDVLARFKNSALPYTAQQVNTDCSQKIQQRWFPTIDAILAANGNFRRMSFALAVWAHYVESALQSDELNDPLRDKFLDIVNQQLDGEIMLQRFLSLAGADQFSFFASTTFINSVQDNYSALKTAGCRITLDKFLNT